VAWRCRLRVSVRHRPRPSERAGSTCERGRTVGAGRQHPGVLLLPGAALHAARREGVGTHLVGRGRGRRRTRAGSVFQPLEATKDSWHAQAPGARTPRGASRVIHTLAAGPGGHRVVGAFALRRQHESDRARQLCLAPAKPTPPTDTLRSPSGCNQKAVECGALAQSSRCGAAKAKERRAAHLAVGASATSTHVERLSCRGCARLARTRDAPWRAGGARVKKRRSENSLTSACTERPLHGAPCACPAARLESRAFPKTRLTFLPCVVAACPQ
jgi:hypothetical protein